MKKEEIMIKAIIITGIAIMGAIGILAHEVGNYCEEINPYNNDLSKDIGADFDCSGCMGASFNDCDDCREKRR